MRRVWCWSSFSRARSRDSTARCCATTIGWCTASCMPPSSRLSASRPPQDVPITMISYTSRGLSIDALGGVDDGVRLGERREGDRFLPAECQHAEGVEALVEQPVHAILQRLVEVDHHVPADD